MQHVVTYEPGLLDVALTASQKKQLLGLLGARASLNATVEYIHVASGALGYTDGGELHDDRRAAMLSALAPHQQAYAQALIRR